MYSVYYLTAKCFALMSALSKEKNSDFANKIFHTEHSIQVGCAAVYKALKELVYIHNVDGSVYQELFSDCD